MGTHVQKLSMADVRRVSSTMRETDSWTPSIRWRRRPKHLACAARSVAGALLDFLCASESQFGPLPAGQLSTQNETFVREVIRWLGLFATRNEGRPDPTKALSHVES